MENQYLKNNYITGIPTKTQYIYIDFIYIHIYDLILRLHYKTLL